MRWKRRVDNDDLDELRKQIAEYDAWERFTGSEHGKFFLQWLASAIDETLNDEDSRDIYSMDQSAREYFFSAIRSKRQTLKAIRNKMLTASKEKEWRVAELARYGQNTE